MDCFIRCCGLAHPPSPCAGCAVRQRNDPISLRVVWQTPWQQQYVNEFEKYERKSSQMFLFSFLKNELAEKWKSCLRRASAGIWLDLKTHRTCCTPTIYKCHRIAAYHKPKYYSIFAWCWWIDGATRRGSKLSQKDKISYLIKIEWLKQRQQHIQSRHSAFNEITELIHSVGQISPAASSVIPSVKCHSIATNEKSRPLVGILYHCFSSI